MNEAQYAQKLLEGMAHYKECISCGHPLALDARFCSKCGARQDEGVGANGFEGLGGLGGMQAQVPQQPTRNRPDESPTKVFVGGLSSQTSLDILQAYFEQFGALVDSVVMKDKASGKPRGFGFVTFDNPDSVEVVMQAAGQHQIDGKLVEVKRCEPRGAGFVPFNSPAQSPRPSFGRAFAPGMQPAMQPMMQRMMQSVYPGVHPGLGMHPGLRPMMHQGKGKSKDDMLNVLGGMLGGLVGEGFQPAASSAMITDKIFIGGLGECSEDVLADYFGQFGRVVDHVVMRDKVSGKPRGFGFVTFDSPEAVDAVLLLGHTDPNIDGRQLETSSSHFVNGRAVEVKRASPKPGQEFSFTPAARPTAAPIPQHRSNKVFIGGLGECLDEELHAHFAQFGTLIDCIVMKDKATGKSRGFGFVQYDDPLSVDLVMAQQHNINGRWVELKHTVPEEGGKGKARSSPY